MEKKKLIIIFMIVFLIQCLIPQHVFAQSNYVLPYPSYMPGSPLYKLHRGWEIISKYWYFGNFSQFVYNLKLSDKYLVEAKTLFEYKQYLFAYGALKKSDEYFDKAFLFLDKARGEGKNTEKKEVLFREAAQKHIEVIQKIKQSVPETFMWKPEKEKETLLSIWEKLDKAIENRKRYL